MSFSGPRMPPAVWSRMMDTTLRSYLSRELVCRGFIQAAGTEKRPLPMSGRNRLLPPQCPRAEGTARRADRGSPVHNYWLLRRCSPPPGCTG